MQEFWHNNQNYLIFLVKGLCMSTNVRTYLRWVPLGGPKYSNLFFDICKLFLHIAQNPLNKYQSSHNFVQFCNLCNRGDLNSPPRFLLLKSFPFAIGGFVDAAEFAPATEERIDAGRRDRLVLTRSQTDELSGMLNYRKNCDRLSILSFSICHLHLHPIGLWRITFVPCL